MDVLAEEIKTKMDHYFATVSDEQLVDDLDALDWRHYAELQSMEFNRVIALDREEY